MCVHVGSCIVYKCLYTSPKLFMGMSVSGGVCVCTYMFVHVEPEADVGCHPPLLSTLCVEVQSVV